MELAFEAGSSNAQSRTIITRLMLTLFMNLDLINKNYKTKVSLSLLMSLALRNWNIELLLLPLIF